MHPDVWARAMWQTIHSVALGYPRAPRALQKAAYRAFYAGLGEIIPCETCAAAYRRMMLFRGGLRRLDAALDGMDASSCPGATSPLFDWTVDVHNAVSRELRDGISSPDFDWTPERAFAAVVRGGTEGGGGGGGGRGGDAVVATWMAMAVGFLVAALVVACCILAFKGATWAWRAWSSSSRTKTGGKWQPRFVLPVVA